MPPEPDMLELMAQLEARVADLEQRNDVLWRQIAVTIVDLNTVNEGVEELQRGGDDMRRAIARLQAEAAEREALAQQYRAG
jgi:cell division protein ZapA (FtsZ GTPase activity inhibitor)